MGERELIVRSLDPPRQLSAGIERVSTDGPTIAPDHQGSQNDPADAICKTPDRESRANGPKYRRDHDPFDARKRECAKGDLAGHLDHQVADVTINNARHVTNPWILF